MKPPKPPVPQTSRQDALMFDLQAAIKMHAINLFVATKSKAEQNLNVQNLEIRIIWDDIIVVHETPEYVGDRLVSLPNCHSLFTTTFRNNTDAEQEYSFRTERCTRSVAEIEIQRGVVTTKEMSLKLALPNSVLEAGAGFHREISLTSAAKQSNEEELTWGVDTKIVVPPKHSAVAEIKVAEEQLTNTFRMLSSMTGRIRCTFHDPNNNGVFVKYVEADLGSIVEQALKRQQGGSAESLSHVWVESHSNGRKVVFIETTGKCAFRFGVNQDVEVNQKKL